MSCRPLSLTWLFDVSLPPPTDAPEVGEDPKGDGVEVAMLSKGEAGRRAGGQPRGQLIRVNVESNLVDW